MVKTKEEVQRIKKPFIISAICLISILILSVFSFVFSALGLLIVSSIFSILIFSGVFLVFAGYYYLGKKHKSSFLMRVIITGFVIFIASFLFFSIYTSYNSDAFIELNETVFMREANLEKLVLENASEEVLRSYEKETVDYIIQEGLPLLVPFLIAYFVYAIYLTLFGIAFVRLKNVKYSKAIGVLNIVSVWLVISIIGIVLAVPMMFVSYILTILMFFDESKKSKE